MQRLSNGWKELAVVWKLPRIGSEHCDESRTHWVAEMWKVTAQHLPEPVCYLSVFDLHSALCPS